MDTRRVLLWIQGRITRAVLALLVAALFLVGLVTWGKWAQQRLRSTDRYSINFNDIHCEPPPGETRADFLGEVQYLAGLPDRLQILDSGLRPRLRAAFALHPWVKEVEGVETAPPRRVHVRLQYRKPVLAVSVSGQLRAVDEQGILLPASAPTAQLPVFEGKATSPAGPAGTRWGDPAVEAAARKAAASIK